MKTRHRASGKLVVQGTPVAPGIAVGVAVFHEMHDVDIPVLSIREKAVPAELDRFSDALAEAQAQLEEVEKSVETKVGRSDARIFSVQRMFADDPNFRSGVRKRIRDNRVNAEVAVRDEVADWEARVASLSEDLQKDPMADLRDFGHRLIRILSGRTGGAGPAMDAAKGGRIILVTKELLPSDAANLERESLAAIVTAQGGSASHAAILSRALGIPAVSGIDVDALPRRGGRWIVDGGAGEVVVNPGTQETSRARRRSEDFKEFRDELLADTRGVASTKDGVEIEMQVNVENWQSLSADLVESLGGVGLYRTEFLFMNRPYFPTEEEQYEHYRDALQLVGDRQINFRTIDVGGDKPLPYLSVPVEPNPVLGWRGLRLSLQWPDMLYSQFRALLRASAHGRLRILLPMVTMVEEFRHARDILSEVHDDLRRHGIPCADDVPLGAMVEVPAAALAAGTLAAEADFLSIGTNDLSQYALAVDRNNARVADLYQQLHPGVLSIVRHVVDAAAMHDTPVSVCGEMAGDPEAALLLLGFGVRSLSMSPFNLPLVKRLIGTVTLEQAEAVTAEAVRLDSTTEIRVHVRARVLELVPELQAWLTPEVKEA